MNTPEEGNAALKIIIEALELLKEKAAEYGHGESYSFKEINPELYKGLKELINAMGKAENKIETYFTECIEELGGYTYKNNGTGRRGKLDRTAYLPYGLVWIVECKRELGGECSSGQIREIQRLESLGQRVAVVATREEVDTLMYEIRMCMEIFYQKNL